MARNPWLDVPAADYVGHMSDPAVDQLSTLSRLFREALERFRPAAVLLPGCATGNGLEQVEAAVTRRITAIDLNPEYVARLRERFPDPDFELDLECADLMHCDLAPDGFDLVHCALLFEYLDWRELLPRLTGAIRAGGGLSVVLQCPSADAPAVTPTNYAGLRKLERVFHFVEPSAVAALATAHGLEPTATRLEPLLSGKFFAVMHFRKPEIR